jgi:hypothetical protein
MLNEPELDLLRRYCSAKPLRLELRLDGTVTLSQKR